MDEYKVITGTLAERVQKMNEDMGGGFTRLGSKIDNVMWKFITFGVGTVLLSMGTVSFPGCRLVNYFR
jgi:hypothetical protein